MMPDLVFSDWVIFGVMMFTGGFMDALVGGGGLLTVPAYMIMGLPIGRVIGCNKLSATLSTLTSFAVYVRGYDLKLKMLVRMLPFSFAGAFLGAKLFLFMSTDFLEALVPFLLIAVGIYSLFNKNLGAEDHYTEPTNIDYLKGGFFVFLAAMYDGFFGPGSGVFFIMALVKVFKVDFVAAAGGTRLLNVMSALTGCTVHFLAGNVIIQIGLVGFAFMGVGSIMGSKLAIAKGSKVMRPAFVIICLFISVGLLLRKFGISLF